MSSTRLFMRELNRFGLTSVIDAGGGFQNYPEDYNVITALHEQRLLTLRFAYNLFTQKPTRRAARLPALDDDDPTRRRGRLFPDERRGRDAGLLRRRFRGLPGATPRDAAHHGVGPQSCRAAARRTPLAVPPARHLRRDDWARPAGLRGGPSYRPPQRSALVLRSLRDDLGPQHRAHSTPLAAALPSSIAWPTRGNTLSIAMAPSRRGPGRQWPPTRAPRTCIGSLRAACEGDTWMTLVETVHTPVDGLRPSGLTAHACACYHHTIRLMLAQPPSSPSMGSQPGAHTRIRHCQADHGDDQDRCPVHHVRRLPVWPRSLPCCSLCGVVSCL